MVQPEFVGWEIGDADLLNVGSIGIAGIVIRNRVGKPGNNTRIRIGKGLLGRNISY